MTPARLMGTGATGMRTTTVRLMTLIDAAAARLRTRRPQLPVVALYATGAGVVYGLKAFYSGANADELRWVLGPTCWLAARLGGMTFDDEAGAGFISHAQRLVVGPACSGVNFLIACFAALFFSFAHRVGAGPARAAWLPASLVVAWVATVATNAVRVTLAAPLYHANIYGDLVTPARAHRLLGTVLYCGSRLVVHAAVARRLARRRPDARPGPVRADLLRGLRAPVAFYLGLAIVVPLARRGLRGLDGRLLEHVAMVGGTVLVLAGLHAGLNAVVNRLANRLQSRVSEE
jgi:exosortase K